VLGLRGFAVDTDLRVFDEKLNTGTADVGECLGEVLVEAEVGSSGVSREGADAVLCVVFEFKDRNGRWKLFFDAASGDVFRTDGATALALGEHVLRRHG
jgi:hypothetical protein